MSDDLAKALAIIDSELQYYQEEHDRKNLTEMGQHSFAVLRRIRERIGGAVSSPSNHPTTKGD